MRTPRRLFLGFLLLSYAFLGAGPSLWALGLNQEAGACSSQGCCKMGPGIKCRCRFMASLLKKYPELAKASPGHCEMRTQPLAPQEAADGQHNLPSLQPHLAASAGLAWQLAESRSLPLPAPRGSSFHPEPPTPIPD